MLVLCRYQGTIGIDFVTHVMTLGGGEPPMRLQIWDTAGQERFRSLTPSYVRNAAVVLVVFDVVSLISINFSCSCSCSCPARAHTLTVRWVPQCNVQSFEDTQMWKSMIEMHTTPPGPAVVLVGNKIDKEQQRTVSTADGRVRAREYGCAYIETSAKTGHNVKDAFQTAVRAHLDAISNLDREHAHALAGGALHTVALSDSGGAEGVDGGGCMC